MTSSLVAVVVFLGMLLAALPLGRALALRRRVAEVERSRRIALGRDGDAATVDDGAPPPSLGDAGHLIRGPGGLSVDVVEVAAGLTGALVGAVVVGVPTGLLGAGAGLLPLAWGRYRQGADARSIAEALPEALDVLGSAVRVGHGFPRALRLAAAETSEPLATTLVRVADHHDLGIPLREALEDMLARHPASLELRLFASAVVFQRQAGGNLVELLEQLSASIRDRAMFDAKARTITAEVRNSTNVLGVLPVLASAAVVLFVPDHFDPMLRSTVGRALLLGSALAVVTGTAVVHGLARALEP